MTHFCLQKLNKHIDGLTGKKTPSPRMHELAEMSGLEMFDLLNAALWKTILRRYPRSRQTKTEAKIGCNRVPDNSMLHVVCLTS